MKLKMYKQWLVDNLYYELHSLAVTSCSCCKYVDKPGKSCNAYPGINIEEHLETLAHEYGCPHYARDPQKYKAL